MPHVSERIADCCTMLRRIRLPLTSSKVMPRVSEHLWPMFNSFLPTWMPGVSASTIKPVVEP